jgi:predicted TIM-barrel fold metal-dependent hydrolase
MNALDFALSPATYGLPTREELKDLRIWDEHYHGLLNQEKLTGDHDLMRAYLDRLGIERVFSVDIALDVGNPPAESAERNAADRQLLEEQKDFLSGIIRIDPADPKRSLQKIEDWIANGPCVGIKYAGGNPAGIHCSHPSQDIFIRRAVELNAMIYIHAWLEVGGEPRRPGGANPAGENTPMDVVELGKRFPNAPIICGHSGGDWELGVQVVRPYENIYFEFAGSDSHSGEVDHAVNELGIDRLTWGGHGPSRSFATELSKVLDATLTKAERQKILGGNLRRLYGPIFRRKGYSLESRWQA